MSGVISRQAQSPGLQVGNLPLIAVLYCPRNLCAALAAI